MATTPSDDAAASQYAEDLLALHDTGVDFNLYGAAVEVDLETGHTFGGQPHSKVVAAAEAAAAAEDAVGKADSAPMDIERDDDPIDDDDEEEEFVSAKKDIADVFGYLKNSIQAYGHALVRLKPSDLPQAVRDAVAAYGDAHTELPLVTTLSEDHPDYIKAPGMLEPTALTIGAFVYRILRETAFVEGSTLVPAPAHFLEAAEENKCAPGALAQLAPAEVCTRYVSCGGTGVAAVMALNSQTLRIPVLPLSERASDAKDDVIADVLDRVRRYSRALARAAPAGESGEFSYDLTAGGKVATAILDGAWVEHQLRAGDVLLIPSGYPYQLVPAASPVTKEYQWPRVAVSTAITEYDPPPPDAAVLQRPTCENGIGHRLDLAKARARGGVFRHGRYGTEIPLTPGARPGLSRANPLEDGGAMYPGDDAVLARVPMSDEGCTTTFDHWSTDVMYGPNTWGLFYDAARLDKPKVTQLWRGRPRKATVAKALSSWCDLARESCRAGFRLAECAELGARSALVGLPGFSEKKIADVNRALDFQLQQINRFKEADIGTLAKYLDQMEAGIAKSETVLSEREAVRAALPELAGDLEAYRELAAQYPDNKNIQNQLETVTKKLGEVTEVPTKAKLDSCVKSANVLSERLSAAAEKASSSTTKRKRKPGSDASPSPAKAQAVEYPDPETFVPQPEEINDVALMQLVAEEWKRAYNDLKKIQKARARANQPVKKEAIYTRLLTNRDGGSLYYEAQMLHAALHRKEPYDISKGNFIVQRLKCWPENPFEHHDRLQREAERKRRRAESDSAACNTCYNEKLVTEKVRAQHEYPTRCITCLADTQLRTANAALKMLMSMARDGAISDVVRSSAQIAHDERNPELADESPEERVERILGQMQESLEQMDEQFPKVEETPAVRGKVSRAFKDFEVYHSVFARYASMFKPAEVGDVLEAASKALQNGNSEDEDDEYVDEEPEREEEPYAECCGAILLPNGRCSECNKKPAARGFRDEEEEEEEEQPSRSRRSTQDAVTAPQGASLSGFSFADVLSYLEAQIPAGPVHESYSQLRPVALALVAGSRVSNPEIEHALYVSTKQEPHPDTGDRVFSRSQGYRIDDRVNSFSSADACAKWAAASYGYKDDPSSPLFVAPVISFKRGADQQQQEDEAPAKRRA